MRLGLALPQFGAHSGADQITSFARTGEQLGYGSLWVADRVLAPVAPSDFYPVGGTPQRPYPPEFRSSLDPVVVLAAAAAATTTARLASSTINAPWHDALLLARSLTSLDRLCGGRLDVGFGLGWLRDEYTATSCPCRSAPGAARRAAGWLLVHGIPADVTAARWQIGRHAAEEAGRDPDLLRRELRINLQPGQDARYAIGVLAQARDAGIDGACLDLQYVTSSVDESLSIAADVIAKVGALD